MAVAEKSTYIKLDRNLLKWRWFQNPKTLIVWIWLIMNANIEDHDFEKETIRRGEVATSRRTISAATGLTEREVRTALDHLKSTGEVSVRIRSKYQVISIPEYCKYQDVPSGKQSGKRPAGVRQTSGKRPQLKNKRMEEGKNEKNVCATHIPPDRAEVEAYAESQGIRTDIDSFLQYNAARGWKGIVDWQPLFLKWASHDDGNARREPDEDLDDFGRPIRKEFK